MEINDKLVEEVINWRRYLHQYPEISNEEVNTSNFIFDTLQTFPNLEVSRPTKTSVVATLKNHRSMDGMVIAFRADIDALPIEEKNDVAFKSTKKGLMHACGHDAHTAMLLGAAKRLTEDKSKINGEIRFIFQHAEEVVPGGAKELVEKGILDGVDMAFALHVTPNERSGTFGIKSGVLFSAEDYFKIKVLGSGGHASTPELTVDPLIIGAEITTNLQQVVSRKVPILKAPVLSVTTFHCGNVPNVIAEDAVLEGTIRSYDEGVRIEVKEHVERVVKGVTLAHGATYEMTWTDGNGFVQNNQQAVVISKRALEKVVGSQNIIFLEEPLLASEDFAAMAEAVPASMQLIGVHGAGMGKSYPLHHPKFQVDENALQYGVNYYVAITKELDILSK